MDHSYVLMDSFITRLLQDNGAAVLWNNSRETNRSPIAISMAARLVSPPGQSRGYSPSPIGQAHAQTHTHTQTHTQAQAQSEAAIARHRHRQPLHPLPLSRPGTSSTLSRPRRPHSSTITTTTTTSTTTTTTAAASTNALPNISTPPRRRPTSTAPPPQSWHAQPVHLWPTDDHDLLNLADPFGTSQPGNALVDDPYLAAFAEADFSSPSSYPSFTEPDAHLSQSHAQTRPPPVPQDSRPLPSAPSPSATAAPRDPSGACSLDLNCTAAQRSTTQLSSTTAGESQSTWPTLDSFDFADSDLFDSPASSFSDNMPQTRRRPPPTAPPHEVVHASKRRRTSTNVSNQTPTKSPSSRRKHQPHANKDVDDSLFESNQPPPHLDVDAPSSDFTTIDLTEANEVPEDLKKPVEDNRIKLVAFQCVICMDDVTTLTVTHCGHLYCAQCLHSSLHVEATKGKCPMCRQKLDMKPRESYNSKTKGFWPLELKLMTATRKGKRKADSQL